MRFNSGFFREGKKKRKRRKRKRRKKKVCTCSRPLLLLSVCIIFFYALKPCIFNYRYLVEEIKKREGFQLLLEVSENGTELLLLGGVVCIYCLILFFLANCLYVFEVYNIISLCIGDT